VSPLSHGSSFFIPIVTTLKNISQIKAGYYHTLALNSTGTLFAFGYNYYGQIGNGLSYSSSVQYPFAVMNNVSNTEIGYCYSIAINSSGAFHFGNNPVNSFQLISSDIFGWRFCCYSSNSI
jgi:alpha-tubulin suppressor-like RCC1 family protein